MVMKSALPGVVALLAGLLSAGCGGPDLVKGQSPFVSISSMAVDDGTLAVTFNFRNINDLAMNIDSVAVTMTSRDVGLLRYNARHELSIDPNTTEDLVIEQITDEEIRPLLDSLQAGDIESLPFSIEGRAHTAADGNLPFRQQGYLFRVPGKPGQFRATSSRTREQH